MKRAIFAWMLLPLRHAESIGEDSLRFYSAPGHRPWALALA